MVTSPRGFPFETIAFDVEQMDTLHKSLSTAKKHVANMQLVLRNVSENLEGSGLALDKARTVSAEVAGVLENPAARIRRIASIVLRYGTDAETYGGRANLLMTDVTEAQTALETAQADVAVAEAALSAWTGSVECAAWQAGAPTDTSPTALLTRHERCNDAAATPDEVAAIWDSLTDAERERLSVEYPEFVGNLEGIPYEYRIAANVAVLEVASQTSWGEPTDGEIAALLAELKDSGGMPISLNLSDKNQATAAILYVDDFSYDRASLNDPLAGVTNVNVLIGGMMTELNQVASWGDSARGFNESLRDQGAVSATIAWFGYDTPNPGTVGSSEQARAGAETLTNALRGLDHEAPTSATTTVVGHSYGSTMAFLAVGSASDNLGVDNLIAAGSAGLGESALGDDPDRGLDFSGSNVFATLAPGDLLAPNGRWLFSDHPVDPGAIENAVVFDSDGGYMPNDDGSEPTETRHDGQYLKSTPGHGTHDEANLFIGMTVYPGGYLQAGSESFTNIANIMAHGEPLTTPDGYGSDDWWLW